MPRKLPPNLYQPLLPKKECPLPAKEENLQEMHPTQDGLVVQDFLAEVEEVEEVEVEMVEVEGTHQGQQTETQMTKVTVPS